MPMYMVLVNLTDQGMRNVKEMPARIDAWRKGVKAAGGELQSVFMSMGRYDTISIIQAQSDEIMAKIALSLNMIGNVNTETLRLFTEEETRKVIQGMS